MNQHTPHPIIALAPAVPGEWFDGLPGERMRIRVHSRTVGGRLTVIESCAQPMAGSPLHRHPQDEIFSVMFGCLTFHCGTERVVAPSGTIVIARAGTPHVWCNFGRLPARMMVSFTPGGSGGDIITGKERLASQAGDSSYRIAAAKFALQADGVCSATSRGIAISMALNPAINLTNITALLISGVMIRT